MRASSVTIAMALALALAAVPAGCSSDAGTSALPGSEARKLMENRNWLDRWPTSEDERLYVYRFTPEMGGGVFQDRTLFAGRFELFTYQLGDDVVVIRWPDRAPGGGVEETIHYQIDQVAGPEPFDLRLTLRGTSLGPKVFYGIRSETGTAGALETALRRRHRSPGGRD